MSYLVAVTLLWAFSFSLIGVYLAGQVDAYFAVLMRIALAVLVFLPWLLRKPVALADAFLLAALGAVQLGLMYIFYYQSFLLLSVPQILVFTIFTPVYITLLYDVLDGHFNPRFLFAALLAVVAAAVMRDTLPAVNYWLGFLVVQGANFCFAAGQVGYKKFMASKAHLNAGHQQFGWFYVGALVIALPAWLLLGQAQYPTTSVQWAVLLWLGLVASGAGYFWWNKGASQVSSGTLAVMNNALIPAGLLVNILIWQRDTDLTKLVLGIALLLLSLWLCRRHAV
ncbi:EamA family transporter [Rheinheimera sp. UJ51]|uniref:EamA family transporter n=1 Tax=unclassified Rheinheimera TaxID=115860 RepID=UPI001E58EB39|nr:MULTISPECIES: EamA family transporter [unclassified Rheinheimera]MCC5451695.1 EamA family transporter [Rheinheimera sp. UJ51]MCF4009698.1 EamA family transporter [Rheinheimera sp. UJ63]